ncbi:MAG TPA: class I SAM-dependent methyltransferase [Dehalococcoidia bacterium]|nr:class I SAM-dependent methyltransferase [Dehalococcoidia bacterium]HIK98058.1 class I SAM-dependent methyltransferase [Dehalococcoidia bacterium]
MNSIYRRFRRRAALTQLARIFERSAMSTGRALPIRKTGRGIHVATPIRVIEEAVKTLTEIGLVGEGRPTGCVIDAGTGDGRIPAVLAAFDPSRAVYGIEANPALYAQAVTNLQTLDGRGLVDVTHLHLLEGDYCDVGTYETHEIALRQIGVIFNYPDGNERRLARFVAAHCERDTMLCLLTHNRTLELDELERLASHDVSDGAGPQWRLSVYSRTSAKPVPRTVSTPS